MNLADCYRLLGLRSGAAFSEIKASYRRLARQYHPDVNPGDQRAKEKFIELTAAYKLLLSNVKTSEGQASQSQGTASNSAAAASPVAKSPPPTPKVTVKQTKSETQVKVTKKQPGVEFSPQLSAVERQLKQAVYEQLQQLLRDQRFPKAVTIVEGLAQRIPQDPEVRQWQAIVYQRLGRHLVSQKQFDKARIYLKKALRTDPHNRSLWAEVERDFRRIEQIL
ncbi:MAG: DnaJ domain-containing protein [Trichocoleus desertorum ATA4-8-CV12]|jgi:tetratricopeptide (TPR) repeat protein|nr:DnaJ domain-containing protein [Trichocoleus desertorum ATA4-8-CV12]